MQELADRWVDFVRGLPLLTVLVAGLGPAALIGAVLVLLIRRDQRRNRKP